MTEEAFVPIEGIAKYFAVSISTVRAWIRQGLIPALKLGGVYRFKISEVETALRKLGGEVVEEVDGSLTVNAPEGQAQLELNFNPDEDI